MSVEVGQAAPGFELEATTGETITLEDRRGRGTTVLLFVPLAFTPVCTNELSIIRDEYEFYTGLGAEVFAASVDSVHTLKVWGKQLDLPYPLLSDFNKDTARAYGALYDQYGGLRGVAKRSAFVIDRERVVCFRWVSEDSSLLPPFDEIKAAVEQAASI